MSDSDASPDVPSGSALSDTIGALREIAHVPDVSGALREVALPTPLQGLEQERDDAGAVPRPGFVAGGRYRLDAVLGAGGMGVVYAAQHLQTGKLVALKWLSLSQRQRGTRDRAQALARFAREARAAGRIRHPNVVDVYDASSDEQAPFLVMERLEGETLRARIARSPLEWHEVMLLLVPAMRGVVELHRQGIVHRDLKPDNVYLAQLPGQSQPCAKVLDFGVSRLRSLDSVEDSLTHTGAIVGTPSYMPLEQLRGDDGVDERTDVFALGVMLFEALSGKRPWSARSAAEYGALLVSTPPTRLSALVPALKGAREAAIMKALERRPEDRYADVSSFIAALEQASKAPGRPRRGLLVAALAISALAIGASWLVAWIAPEVPAARTRTPEVRVSAAASAPLRVEPPPATEPEPSPAPVAAPAVDVAASRSAPRRENPARPPIPSRGRAAAPTLEVTPDQALDALQPGVDPRGVVKQPTDHATSLARDEF